METLEGIQANIITLAPGYSATFDDNSLVISSSVAKELRIKQVSQSDFRVVVRERSQAKLENFGGGNLVDFNGVLAEINSFTNSELN